MSEHRTCPQCGSRWPGTSPAGLCPKCLLAAGLDESPSAPGLGNGAGPMGTEEVDAASGPLPGPGTRLRYFGDYELLEEIARGGMGIVYKARQLQLDRVVALKMILAGQFASEADIRRFQLEAKAAAQLDHPGIVPIFEIGEHEGLQYFSMGFVEGDSLAHRLLRGPFPPREAAELITQVARVVEYAHEKGVIHRDLKPANILLDRKGQPKVTDFGLAKAISGNDRLTQTGQVLGTPCFMAPEQASAAGQQVRVGADVYALGAVLYNLVTGRPPFQSDSPLDTLRQVIHEEPVAPRQLNARVSRDLETIILKCLEKSVARRYHSAQALAADLQRWLEGQPIAARRVSGVERSWRWLWRNRRTAGVGTMAAAAGMVLLLGGWAAWKSHDLHDRGRLMLQTDARPPVAVVRQPDGSVVDSPITLPTQEPLRLSPGSYEVQVDMPGQLSEQYRVDVASRLQTQGFLPNDPRDLWPPIDLAAEDWVEPVTFAAHRTELLMASADGLSRIQYEEGRLTPVWHIVPEAKSHPILQPLGTLRWERVHRAEHMGEPAGPNLVRPLHDLNGDGVVDPVLAGRGFAGEHTFPLVAFSGANGRPLWVARPEEPGASGPHPAQPAFLISPPIWVQGGQGPVPHVVFAAASANRQRVWLQACSGRDGSILWQQPLPEWRHDYNARPLILLSVRHGDGDRVHVFGPKRHMSVRESDGAVVSDITPLQAAYQGKPEVIPGTDPIVLFRTRDESNQAAGLMAWSPERRRPLWHHKLGWTAAVPGRGPEAPGTWPWIIEGTHDGSTRLAVPTVDEHGWLGLTLLQAVDGSVQWQRHFGPAPRMPADVLVQCRPIDDLDGDGVPEWAVAAVTQTSPILTTTGQLSVDALSLKTGKSLWWHEEPVRMDPLWGAPLGALQLWQPAPDGRAQLVIPYRNDAVPSPDWHNLMLQQSNGRVLHSLREFPRPVVGDMDGDGLPDLLTLGDAELLPQGRITRIRALRGAPPELWRRLELLMPGEDYNGDGRPELLHWNQQRVLCLSSVDGAPLWETRHTGQNQLVPLQGAHGDLDADGAPDLIGFWQGAYSPPLVALSGRTGRILWHDQLRSERQQNFFEGFISSPDLDRDGCAEIVVVYQQATGGHPQHRQRWLAVLDGRQGTTRWRRPLSSERPWNQLFPAQQFVLATADLDGDGTLDLAGWRQQEEGMVVAAFSGRNGSELWQANTTTQPMQQPAPQVRFVCRTGDLDGDGVMEVLAEWSGRGLEPGDQTSLWALDGRDGTARWVWQGSPKPYNAGGWNDPSPAFVRQAGGAPAVVVVTQGADRSGLSLNLLNATGQTVASTPLAGPESGEDLSSRWQVISGDDEAGDWMVWVNGTHLQATRTSLADPAWALPLPEGGIDLLSMHASVGDGAYVAGRTDGSLLGWDLVTGRPAWRSHGPGAASVVLGAGTSEDWPLVLYTVADPDNAANQRTICRAAWPVTDSGRYTPEAVFPGGGKMRRDTASAGAQDGRFERALPWRMHSAQGEPRWLATARWGICAITSLLGYGLFLLLWNHAARSRWQRVVLGIVALGCLILAPLYTAGVPLIAFLATAVGGWSKGQRFFSAVVLALAGLIAVSLAALSILADRSRMHPLENYDMTGAPMALLWGGYLTGLGLLGYKFLVGLRREPD